jgi:hypothetical protein
MYRYENRKSYKKKLVMLFETNSITFRMENRMNLFYCNKDLK